MDIEKELGDSTAQETFTAVTGDLSVAVSGGALITEIKTVAAQDGNALPAEAGLDQTAFVPPDTFEATHCDGESEASK